MVVPFLCAIIYKYFLFAEMRQVLLLLSVWTVFFFPVNPELVAVEVNTKLPTRNLNLACEYDGSDAIYIFGGYALGIEPDVLKYTISTDRVEVVASFPSVRYGGSATSDKNGSIYHLGGYIRGTGETDSIWRYVPSTGAFDVVGFLVYKAHHFAVVKPTQNSDEMLIFDANRFNGNIESFNMSTLTSRIVGELPISLQSRISAVSDGEGSAFLFGNTNSSTPGFHGVLKVNLTTFNVTYGEEDLPFLSGRSAVVYDGTYAYILGGYRRNETAGIRTDSVIQFDPKSMRNTLLPVANFPARDTSFLDGTCAVYVSSRNRIYFIGGAYSSVYYDKIWFIQLDEDNEPTSTTTSRTTVTTTTPPEQSSTTMNPDVFTCISKPDGMYPHPYDCAKFISCRGEVLAEYKCPEHFLFDPIALSCNVPELVDCEITCV